MGLFGLGKKEAKADSNESKYGKAWLLIVGQSKKNQGLQIMQELSNAGFHEATIALSMFVNNPMERMALVKKAADAGNVEGMWELAAMSQHSYVPDRNNKQDAAWEEMCTKAAEAGSVDAMNELGNVFNRREEYAESMYWYAMANANDHPQGQISMQGVARKWAQNGADKEYKKTSDNFSEARFKVALSYLEMNAGMDLSISPDEMVKLTLDGEPIAGYFAGDVFESLGNLEMAYKMYNALCFENDAHAIRCYADMLMSGHGTQKDPQSAVGMYMKAAELGERTAMFIAGEFMKNTDKYMAAYWYGMAHTRGYEHALTRLIQLAK